MKNISRFFFFLGTLLVSYFCTFAQDNSVEMADTLRSNGKIYVVVAVLLIILTGLIVFLIRIDKKVRQLEKKNEKNS